MERKCEVNVNGKCFSAYAECGGCKWEYSISKDKPCHNCAVFTGNCKFLNPNGDCSNCFWEFNGRGI